MKSGSFLGFRIPNFKDNKIKADNLPRLSRIQTNILIVSLMALIISSVFNVALYLEVFQLSEDQARIVSSATLVFVWVIFVALFLRISSPLINRFFFFVEVESRNIILQTWNYGIWGVFIVFLLAQFTGQIGSLGLSIGVFSAGLAIALQQPIVSIVGWFVVVSRRIYTVGDRITVKGIRGDVHDISLFHTSLLQVSREKGMDQPTGVLITMPNSIILTEPVLNDTIDFPYVWDYLEISITYESDIDLAIDLIQRDASLIVGETMEKAVGRMRPYLWGTSQEAELSEEPKIYVSIGSSWITLTVRYLCRATKRLHVKTEITKAILKSFNSPGNRDKVAIAYPHTELVFRDQSITGVARKHLEKQ
jgi:small-conductance mechanosensitive channel